MSLQVGSKVPDFNLQGVDSKSHSLSDFKGKYLVLYFYPKDDTPGCTIEAKEFTSNYDEIRKIGAEVVGISADSYESHCSFRDKHALKILLLSDPSLKTIREYGAYGNRGVFGEGTMRKTFIIDKDGKLVKEYPKVSPLGHSKEVISFLKNLSK